MQQRHHIKCSIVEVNMRNRIHSKLLNVLIPLMLLGASLLLSSTCTASGQELSHQAAMSEAEQLVEQFQGVVENPGTFPKIRRQQLAFKISQSPEARLILKRKGREAAGQAYRELMVNSQDGIFSRMVEKAKQKLAGKYPADKIVNRIELVRNQGSVNAPMDADAGIMTETYEKQRQLISDLGGAEGVDRFHRDLQNALEEAYTEIGEEMGIGSGINPKKAFITGTTSFHPEGYRDPRVLKTGGVAGKGWVQQTADVSKFKANEFRIKVRNNEVSEAFAIIETARGTRKDFDKVRRVFAHMEKITGVKPEILATQEALLKILDDISEGAIDPIAGDRAVRALLGKDIYTACNDLMDAAEAAWRLRKVRPQELMLELLVRYLSDDDFDKAAAAVISGELDALPASAKKLVEELKQAAQLRLISLSGTSYAEFIGDIRKLYPDMKLDPQDEALHRLLKLIEDGSDAEDLAVIFGKKHTGYLKKISDILKPKVKKDVATHLSGKGRFGLWEVDRNNRVILGDDLNLGFDAAVGLAMAFKEISDTVDRGLPADEESRLIDEAVAKNLPVVGNFFQAAIDGHSAFQDGDAAKGAQAGVWLLLGAATLFPPAQLPAMIASLGYAAYQGSGFLWDVSRDKELVRAWIASGKWDEKNGRLLALMTSADEERPVTLQALIGGKAGYKSGLSGTTIAASIYDFMDRSGLSQRDDIKSYKQAILTQYPDFQVDEALRETINTGRSMLATAIIEAGGSRPGRKAAMRIFIRLKEIYDFEAGKAVSEIKRLAEEEYQASHAVGEASETLARLKALGDRLHLPLVAHVDEIHTSFARFVKELAVSPAVRESIKRRRIQLAERYLEGYLVIEQQLKKIRDTFALANVKAPSQFNLTGYLEIDGPRMNDLVNAYINNVIGKSIRDIEAIRRTAARVARYSYNRTNPDPCDRELFIKLADINVRIIDSEDRSLLLDQWSGRQSAAAASRDSALREAQAATERVKDTGNVYIPVAGETGVESGAVTIPLRVWGQLTAGYEEAYAWSSLKWEGTEIYQEQKAVLSQRLRTLASEYDKAKAAGEKALAACIGAEKKEKERLEKEQAEQERIARELEREKLEQERLERERRAWERIEQEQRRRDDERAQQEAIERERFEPGKPEQSRRREDTKAKEPPSCSYKYSEWGDCSRATKKQRRSVIAMEPFGCVQKGSPSLEQDCTPPPTEEERRKRLLDCLCFESIGGCSSPTRNEEGRYHPEPVPCNVLTPPIHCKAGPPCLGCWDRGYIKMSGEAIEGCFKREKFSFDAKAIADIKAVNRKHMEPLKLKLSPDAKPVKAQYGSTVTITAEVSGGMPGYTYSWSGNGTAKDNTFTFINTRKAGSHSVSVTVSDSDGGSASASTTIQVEGITVTIEKTSPAGSSVTVGSQASFKATATGGAELSYLWQPHPEVEFNPFEKSATTTATFRRPGSYGVYVQASVKEGGSLKPVGESNTITITVENPKWKLRFSPESPLVGQEVKATIEPDSSPAPDMKEMNFRWQLPSNARQKGSSQDDREITFILNDRKPANISCIASTKYNNETLGGAGRTITAQGYQVAIKGPDARQELQVWKCETQLGGAPSCGMKKVENQFAVDQEMLFSASVTPSPGTPVSYSWKASPAGCATTSDGGSSTGVKCSSTGSCTVTVTAKSGGIELGSASASASVSISSSDINSSKKSKEAYEKIQKAKELNGQGKIDESITLANEAKTLDPRNTEAAQLASKWGKDKERISSLLGKVRQHVTAGKLSDADRELAEARSVNSKYPPVAEAEKLVREARDKAGKQSKEAADKVARARELIRQKKPGEAIPLLEEAVKLDSSSTEARELLAAAKAEKAGVDKAAKLVAEGYAFEKAGKLPEAVEKYKAAVAAAPDEKVSRRIRELDANMKENKARADAASRLRDEGYRLEQQKQYSQAIEKYRQAQAAVPDQWNLNRIAALEKTIATQQQQEQHGKKLVAEGYEFEKQGKLKQAADKYAESLKYARDAKVEERLNAVNEQLKKQQAAYKQADQYWNEGVNLQKAKRYAEAVAKFRESLRISSTPEREDHLRKLEAYVNDHANADKYWNEGVALQNAKRHAEALAKYKESLRIASTPEHDKHVRSLEAYLEKAGAADRLWKEGIALQDAKRYADALAKYRESLRIGATPDREKHVRDLEAYVTNLGTAENLWKQGTDFYNAKRYKDALAKYKESLKYSSTPERTQYVRDLEASLAAKPHDQPREKPKPAPPATEPGHATVKQRPDTGTTGSRQSAGCWSGQWMIRESAKKEEGSLEIRQSGNSLSGKFEIMYGDMLFAGSFEGSISGNRASGRYGLDSDQSNKSEFTFTISEDCRSFSGTVRDRDESTPMVARRVGGQVQAMPQERNIASSTQETILSAVLINNGRDNIHIFPDGRASAGPQNRVAPGSRRTENIPVGPAGGSVKFIAARGGQQLGWCQVNVAPKGQQSKLSVSVTFTDAPKLTCMPY